MSDLKYKSIEGLREAEKRCIEVIRGSTSLRVMNSYKTKLLSIRMYLRVKEGAYEVVRERLQERPLI